MMSIAIKYTGVPLVFCTGSHFNEIDVKVLFVTVGMPGFGGVEPSPVNIEEKFFNCVKNLQLASQLLEFIYTKKRKQTIVYKGSHAVVVRPFPIALSNFCILSTREHFFAFETTDLSNISHLEQISSKNYFLRKAF